MAEYLKNQDVEKYALVFYQQGIFPYIPEQGQLQHLHRQGDVPGGSR